MSQQSDLTEFERMINSRLESKPMPPELQREVDRYQRHRDYEVLKEVATDLTVPENVRYLSGKTLVERHCIPGVDYYYFAKCLGEVNNMPESAILFAWEKVIENAEQFGMYKDLLKLSVDDALPYHSRSLAKERVRNAVLITIQWYEREGWYDGIAAFSWDEDEPEDIRRVAKQNLGETEIVDIELINKYTKNQWGRALNLLARNKGVPENLKSLAGKRAVEIYEASKDYKFMEKMFYEEKLPEDVRMFARERTIEAIIRGDLEAIWFTNFVHVYQKSSLATPEVDLNEFIRLGEDQTLPEDLRVSAIKRVLDSDYGAHVFSDRTVTNKNLPEEARIFAGEKLVKKHVDSMRPLDLNNLKKLSDDKGVPEHVRMLARKELEKLTKESD